MLIFDLILATRRPAMTGVERYGVRLFEAMREIRPDTVAFVRDPAAFDDPRGLILTRDVHLGWLSLPIDIRRRSLKPEAIIFPTAPASPLFHPTSFPLARILHDAFPWTRANAMPWKGRLLYRDLESLMAPRYDFLFGTTAPVVADLRPHVPRADIIACGNAPGLDLDGPQERPDGVPDDFVLAVGTVEPRKNYERLIDIIESGACRLPIVLVGRPGWGDIVARMEDIAMRHPARLIWLRHMTRDEGLLWLYRHAKCFVTLSLAEGFNMPLVEAGASGRPIVCSDIEIHRVVAPPWAIFATETETVEALSGIIQTAAKAPPMAEAVAAYARLHSWNKVASRLCELMDPTRGPVHSWLSAPKRRTGL